MVQNRLTCLSNLGVIFFALVRYGLNRRSYIGGVYRLEAGCELLLGAPGNL